MAVCPIPGNEKQRIAELHAYHLLDTPPELEFDVTTRIASRLFNAPIALVALMDTNRLWFKSKFGLDLPQLDREIAFCAHAIMQPDQLMIIEDLREDPRFVDNPLVKEGGPALRFYAGAPLCRSNGTVLGTIAILDAKPRNFDAEQRGLLSDLAVSVMTAIENRHQTRELRHLATTDYLTGLANRLQFEKTLSAELSQAKRTGIPVSLLYMDLDRFKSINDTLGHAAGDEVLVQVAKRMDRELREGEMASRLGGDEFAVTLRCGSDAAAAIILAERIVRAVCQPMHLSGGQELSVGMSVGIATTHGEDMPIAQLIERADHALYQAKTQETDRWCVFQAGD